MSNIITPLKLFFFPIERKGNVQEEFWKCNVDKNKLVKCVRVSFLRLASLEYPTGKVKSVWQFAFLFFCLFCFLLGATVKNCREREDINKHDWECVCGGIENTQVRQGSH